MRVRTSFVPSESSCEQSSVTRYRSSSQSATNTFVSPSQSPPSKRINSTISAADSRKKAEDEIIVERSAFMESPARGLAGLDGHPHQPDGAEHAVHSFRLSRTLEHREGHIVV